MQSADQFNIPAGPAAPLLDCWVTLAHQCSGSLAQLAELRGIHGIRMLWTKCGNTGAILETGEEIPVLSEKSYREESQSTRKQPKPMNKHVRKSKCIPFRALSHLSKSVLRIPSLYYWKIVFELFSRCKNSAELTKNFYSE